MRRRTQGDRIAARPLGERHTSPPVDGGAPPPRVVDDAPVVKPCWVIDRHGRQPGLLLEWRRRDTGFVGRVVRPVLEADGWIVVEEWVPAELLEPGMTHGPGREPDGHA